MSKTIWGNPLLTASFIDDAYAAIEYPGIFISYGEHFIANTQNVDTDDYMEDNHVVVGSGVVYWSIYNESLHQHRLYFLYYKYFGNSFLSARNNGEAVVEGFYSNGAKYETVTFGEDDEGNPRTFDFAYFTWFTPEPTPAIKTYYVDAWPEDEFVISVLSKWLFKAPTTSFQRQPLYFIGKRTDWIGNGLSWNFEGDIIAVKPGAWTQVFIDCKHFDDAHAFMLSANEFTVLLVSVDGLYGYNSHRELHSEPMIINRKRYHALHIKWEAPYSFDIPAYVPPDGLPSDEAIYDDLKKYVDEYPPAAYECYWIFTRHGLHMYTGTTVDAISEADVDAIFAGYYMQEGDERSAYVNELRKYKDLL